VLVLNIGDIVKSPCNVEIKCQLDATDEFLLQILLLAQHVSGTFMQQPANRTQNPQLHTVPTT
jgi:hypothetical protein